MIRIGDATPLEQRIRIEWAASLKAHMDGPPTVTKKQLLAALEARGVGVTRQALESWLAGKAAPRPYHQAHLAGIFGVPVRSLFPIEAAA